MEYMCHQTNATDEQNIAAQTANASATRRDCSRLWRASAPTAGLALASRPAYAISLQKSVRNRGSMKVQAPMFSGSSWHQTNFALFGNGFSISRSFFSASG